jgi:hypothetical protein
MKLDITKFHKYEFPQIRSNIYGKKDNFNGDVRGKMFVFQNNSRDIKKLWKNYLNTKSGSAILFQTQAILEYNFWCPC